MLDTFSSNFLFLKHILLFLTILQNVKHFELTMCMKYNKDTKY